MFGRVKRPRGKFFQPQLTTQCRKTFCAIQRKLWQNKIVRFCSGKIFCPYIIFANLSKYLQHFIFFVPKE